MVYTRDVQIVIDFLSLHSTELQTVIGFLSLLINAIYLYLSLSHQKNSPCKKDTKRHGEGENTPNANGEQTPEAQPEAQDL